MKPERCYRCLDLTPEDSLTLMVAPCGCERSYCPSCIADARAMHWWLLFMASRCLTTLIREAA